MRYRAFISYSHRDLAIAQWIHRQLEGWRVPRELVGRVTRHGEVPPSLRPVFRDRDDFAGGASLAEATVAALQASECLVVVCSPQAAASAYVNEEIRLFIALGRANRVVPIIVAGDPRDPLQSCFPPALLAAQRDDSGLGLAASEPLAADAREAGDGKARALAKVVAGLLGLPFDEIARRAEKARRKRIAAFAGIGAGALTFAVALSSYALYQSYQANIAVDRSLFALGGIITRVDSIDTEGEHAEMRAEMLMTQCDMLQGLARGRRELEPNRETICLSERARVLADRGQIKPAVDMMSNAAGALSERVRRQEAPDHSLSLALLRALDDSYRLSAMESPTAAEPWLDRLLQATEDGSRVWPEDAKLRESHAITMQRKFDLLYARRDWPGLQALLERSIELRTTQAASLDPEHANVSRFELASYQLALAALHLGELGQAEPAIGLVEESLRSLASLAEQAPKDHSFALQRIRALHLLATALRHQGSHSDAKDQVDAALQLLAPLLRDAELGEGARAEVEHLQRSLHAANGGSAP